jgi:hypothetical protein
MATAILIHGRDDNNGTRNGTLAGDLKPVPRTFNQTKTLELLLLPAGFNFSNPDLNLTREEFGGMTTFRDSQLNQISGYHMSSASSSSIIHCETSSNSPSSRYLPNIIGFLRTLDDRWCCQTETDSCTQMWSTGEAASDICVLQYPGGVFKRVCIRCDEAATYIARIYGRCGKYFDSTERVGGFVRYLPSLPTMGNANCGTSTEVIWDEKLTHTVDVNVYRISPFRSLKARSEGS